MIGWFKQHLILVFNEAKSQIVKCYHLSYHLGTGSYTLDSNKQVLKILTMANSIIIVMGSSKNTSLTVLQFEEKSDRQKVDLLVQNAKFEAAETMAEENISFEYVSEIKKQHGDYEFNMKHFKEAIELYKQTIFRDMLTVEPSFVIRKFLKENQSNYLIGYLERLHDVYAKFNMDHTILLLKCYCKEPNIREDVERTLDRFIENYGSKVNHDATIQTLRDFGYLNHACRLAKNVGAHDWYIKMNLLDVDVTPDGTPPYLGALQYIEGLEFEYAVEFLRKYAPILLHHIPKQTTNVLIRLCVAYYPVRDLNDKKYDGMRQLDKNSTLNFSPVSGGTREVKVLKKVTKTTLFSTYEVEEYETVILHEKEPKPKFDSPEHFISAYLSEKTAYWLMVLLENVIERIHQNEIFKQLHKEKLDLQYKKQNKFSMTSGLLPPIVYNTLLELYLQQWEDYGSVSKFSGSLGRYFPPDIDPAISGLENDGLTDNKALFQKLLDDPCYDIFPANEELYKKPYDEKIEYLLDLEDAKYVYVRGDVGDSKNRNDQYDQLLTALQLCQTKGFMKGTLLIYKKLGLYYDILRFYMAANPPEYEVIKTTMRKLATLPNPLDINNTPSKPDSYMYAFVLKYFVEQRGRSVFLDTILEKQIKDLLTDIEEGGILSPLEVTDILSINPTVKEDRGIKMELLKGYLSRQLKKQSESVRENNEIIQKNHLETSKLRGEIQEMTTTATVITSQNCAKCGLQLDLPAVHFLCKHSYHQRCVNDDQCQKCWERETKLRRRYEEMFKMSSQPEAEFLESHSKADGGFDSIADYFGKGVLLGRQVLHDTVLSDEEYVEPGEKFDNYQSVGEPPVM